MKSRITPCGDNCGECPRFLAKNNEELRQTALLWYRIGWWDRIVSNFGFSANEAQRIQRMYRVE